MDQPMRNRVDRFSRARCDLVQQRLDGRLESRAWIELTLESLADGS
jgi:hypothetical protein